MVSSRHKYLVISQGIHGFVAYEYDDAPARLAAVDFVTEDRYKIAYQIDNGTFWCLVDEVEPSWIQIGADPPPVGLFWGNSAAATTSDLGVPWTTATILTTAERAIPSPNDGKYKTICLTALGGTFTNNTTVELYKNGSPTGLTVTVNAGNSSAVGLGIVTVSKLDLLTIVYTSTVTGKPSWVSIS